MEPENQHFEQKMTPQEQQIERLLAKAMEIAPRHGLSGRIVQASIASIHAGTEQNLEHQLDLVFATSKIEQLSSRVFESSVASLPSPQSDERSSVLARINVTVLFRQVALAACLTFAAVLAIKFGSTPQQQNVSGDRASVSTPNASTGRNSMNSSVASNIFASNTAPSEVLSAEEEILLLQDLNLSEFTYLTDTREMAFADIAVDLDSLRDDIELWQFGLLTE